MHQWWGTMIIVSICRLIRFEPCFYCLYWTRSKTFKAEDFMLEIFWNSPKCCNLLTIKSQYEYKDPGNRETSQHDQIEKERKKEREEKKREKRTKHLWLPSCKSIKDIQSVQHVQIIHSTLTIEQEGSVIHLIIWRSILSISPPDVRSWSIFPNNTFVFWATSSLCSWKCSQSSTWNQMRAWFILQCLHTANITIFMFLNQSSFCLVQHSCKERICVWEPDFGCEYLSCRWDRMRD